MKKRKIQRNEIVKQAYPRAAIFKYQRVYLVTSFYDVNQKENFRNELKAKKVYRKN